MLKKNVAIGFAALIGFSAIVLAPMTATAKTGAAAKAVQCSREGAAKGLHGKPLKKFRANCERGVRSY